MSKQDWLDYFEAVNGRSASAEEIAQALAAGEFQEEVVVPETPQAPEFVAAPTAPVEEPVAAPQAPEFVAAPTAPVEEPVAAPQAPEFVAAPTAPVEEPVAAPQAPEFVAAPAAPAAPAARCSANCTCRRTSCSSSSRTGSSSCSSEWTCFPTSSTASLPTTDSSSLSTSSLPRSTRTTLSCPTKSIWCSRWWLLELVPFSFETSNSCRKSKSS